MSPENDINPYQIQNRSLAKNCLDVPHLHINFQSAQLSSSPNVHTAQTTLRPRASWVESQILYFITGKGHFTQHVNFSNKFLLPREENDKSVLF